MFKRGLLTWFTNSKGFVYAFLDRLVFRFY